MQKWEYKILDTHNPISINYTAASADELNGKDVAECLTVLGEEGWELVASHELKSRMFGSGERFIFKRPKNKF